MSEVDIKEVVRDRYAEIARNVERRVRRAARWRDGVGAGFQPISTRTKKRGLPEEAVLGSLGCGNPTALAELKEGETVLDLGSGGGIDVLLSARRVGPSGKAYGLDMTDDMLALRAKISTRPASKMSSSSKAKSRISRFRTIRSTSIISNCVINLSADKDRVLGEAFRVLKPGGRFAVSDVVTRGAIPERIRRDVLLWVGCVAGALDETDYRAKLAAAGFESIGIEPTRVYDVEDAREFLTGKGHRRRCDRVAGRRQVHERVRARDKVGFGPDEAGRRLRA